MAGLLNISVSSKFFKVLLRLLLLKMTVHSRDKLLYWIIRQSNYYKKSSIIAPKIKRPIICDAASSILSCLKKLY